MALLRQAGNKTKTLALHLRSFQIVSARVDDGCGTEKKNLQRSKEPAWQLSQGLTEKLSGFWSRDINNKKRTSAKNP